MKRTPMELIALNARRGDAPRPSLPEGCAEVPLGNGTFALIGERPPEPSLKQSRKRRRKTIGAAALLRQQRLETLLPLGDLLPFAPGSDLPPGLAQMIAANVDTIAEGYDRVRGQTQYQVVVSWREVDAAAHFGVGEAEVASLRSRLRTVISDQLVDVATDAIPLPCGPGDVANVVILVSTSAMPALDRALEAIDALWTDGFRVRLLGPGPAISFARAKISPVSSEAIKAAAELLQLPTVHPVDAGGLAQARKAALRRSGQPNAAGPTEIERATQVVKLCANLGKSPSSVGPLSMITLERDGLSLAMSARYSLGEVA